MKLKVELVPTSVALEEPYIIDLDVPESTTILEIKKRIVRQYFALYEREDPTCAGLVLCLSVPLTHSFFSETSVFVWNCCNHENETPVGSMGYKEGDLIEFDFFESSREEEYRLRKRDRAPTD